jgi:hypothetical protein
MTDEYTALFECAGECKDACPDERFDQVLQRARSGSRARRRRRRAATPATHLLLPNDDGERTGSHNTEANK